MRPELPVLIKARALIADPAKWGKGARWAHRGGETFCALEAISSDSAARRALLVAAGLPQGAALRHWNDAPERTHAEVLAAFDKAIASAS